MQILQILKEKHEWSTVKVLTRKKRVWLMLKCKSFKIISLDSNKVEIKYNHWIENA